MNIELYRITRDNWAVKTNEDEVQSFTNIEEASDYMESMGVDTEQIDEALIDLAVTLHSRARFDENNRFIESDDKKLGCA